MKKFKKQLPYFSALLYNKCSRVLSVSGVSSVYLLILSRIHSTESFPPPLMKAVVDKIMHIIHIAKSKGHFLICT